MEPFGLVIFAENPVTPSTRITATSEPIPEGKLFVVEHISGFFQTGGGNVVSQILAVGLLTEQEVYLPIHFTSSIFGGFPPVIPSIQAHQFGSPVKMYVRGGDTITINCDANVSVAVRAIAMGYLIDV